VIRIAHTTRGASKKGVDASSAGETLNAPQPNGTTRSPSPQGSVKAAKAAAAAAAAALRWLKYISCRAARQYGL